MKREHHKPMTSDDSTNHNGKNWLDGARPHTYYRLTPRSMAPFSGGVIDESILTIYVNLQEIATMMCSPIDEISLAVGFLFNEGVINHYDDVALVQANATRSVIDVFLRTNIVKLPRRLTITSGCGGGISFQDLADTHPALDTPYNIHKTRIFQRLEDLQRIAHLYRQVRGVHTAVLCDEETSLLGAEDIGRHNTVDKIAGKALIQGIETRDKLLITSGRISSEMVSKARRLQIPIIMSRTSPTGMALGLAQAWGICLIGYARRQQARIYTHSWRIL